MASPHVSLKLAVFRRSWRRKSMLCKETGALELSSKAGRLSVPAS